MKENQLTNEILDLRKQCLGRGIMYIIFIENSISVFSPKHIMNPNDRDNFLKYLLESSEFQGKLEKPSDVWKSLLINTWNRDFYKFELLGSSIELTTSDMSEIKKTLL